MALSTPPEMVQANDGTGRGCNVGWKEQDWLLHIPSLSLIFLKWFREQYDFEVHDSASHQP